MAIKAAGGDALKPYPVVDDLGRPVRRVGMPRAPRVVALPHFVRKLRQAAPSRVYAYTLRSNHGPLLMQAPTHEALGRPLRWLLTETARAFHKARGRRGRFWERRYRACLVEEDAHALAALRYLDRSAVRAGLVTEPTTYQ